MDKRRSALVWRALRYLPLIPGFALIGYHAIRVDRYPSQIGVTHHSCADASNSARLVFRQKTFCVTDAEAREWDQMWRNEYALIGAVVVCWGISRLVRQRKQRAS